MSARQALVCARCGRPRKSNQPKFCSTDCRIAAGRARRYGLPEKVLATPEQLAEAELAEFLSPEDVAWAVEEGLLPIHGYRDDDGGPR